MSDSFEPKLLKLHLNGEGQEVMAMPNQTLSHILREKFMLTGTKVACDEGTCGSCTVLVDGAAIYSCMMLAFDCEGKEVITLEGLGKEKNLYPVQQAFLDTAASQCGFCTSGIIMTAKALLDRSPNPTREEVRIALSGNICRCTDYSRYVDAILLAGKLMRGGSE